MTTTAPTRPANWKYKPSAGFEVLFNNRGMRDAQMAPTCLQGPEFGSRVIKGHYSSDPPS